MTGIGWENFSAETPDMLRRGTENIEKNYIFRYFVASFTFFVIGLAQILIRKIFEFKIPLDI